MTRPAVCPSCGAGEHALVPAWESELMHVIGAEPDYLGCTECNTMQKLDRNVYLKDEEP